MKKNFIGIFFAIMAVTVLVMRLTAGKVTDRHGESIFAYSCNIAMFAAFLLLGLCPNTVTYILAAVLSGFGFGGLEPALQSMAVAIAPDAGLIVELPDGTRRTVSSGEVSVRGLLGYT